MQLFRGAGTLPTFGKLWKAPYQHTSRLKSKSDVDSLYSNRDAATSREVRSCAEKGCYLFKQFEDNLAQFYKTSTLKYSNKLVRGFVFES